MVASSNFVLYMLKSTWLTLSLGEGLKHQPRPIIFDPWIRWGTVAESSKVFKLALEGKGRGPWVIGGWQKEAEGTRRVVQLDTLLERAGGRVMSIEPKGHRYIREGEHLDWEDILRKLRVNGIESLMIEGGAGVIQGLLTGENRRLVSSVIITLAPVWLGKGALVVNPEEEQQEEDGLVRPLAALTDTTSQQVGADTIICGRLQD